MVRKKTKGSAMNRSRAAGHERGVRGCHPRRLQHDGMAACRLPADSPSDAAGPQPQAAARPLLPLLLRLLHRRRLPASLLEAPAARHQRHLQLLQRVLLLLLAARLPALGAAHQAQCAAAAPKRQQAGRPRSLPPLQPQLPPPPLHRRCRWKRWGRSEQQAALLEGQQRAYKCIHGPCSCRLQASSMQQGAKPAGATAVPCPPVPLLGLAGLRAEEGAGRACCASVRPLPCSSKGHHAREASPAAVGWKVWKMSRHAGCPACPARRDRFGKQEGGERLQHAQRCLRRLGHLTPLQALQQRPLGPAACLGCRVSKGTAASTPGSR